MCFYGFTLTSRVLWSNLIYIFLKGLFLLPSLQFQLQRFLSFSAEKYPLHVNTNGCLNLASCFISVWPDKILIQSFKYKLKRLKSLLSGNFSQPTQDNYYLLPLRVWVLLCSVERSAHYERFHQYTKGKLNGVNHHKKAPIHSLISKCSVNK